ncbi:hypothetical protein AGR8A_Cc40010 [Agrobacterium fabrum str. J-07]|nr:hypothetical protein AGR8A_Cc40010 [Agrobacterium fabrum str. J-07]
MPGGSAPRHIETSSRKSTLQTRSVQTDTAGTLARVVEAATQLESARMTSRPAALFQAMLILKHISFARQKPCHSVDTSHQ